MFNKERKLWGKKECPDFDERMKHNSDLLQIKNEIQIKIYDYSSPELQQFKTKVKKYFNKKR